MLSMVRREFVFFAGLLAVPATVSGQIKPAVVTQPTVLQEDDARLPRLRRFFLERKSPLTRLAADFLHAADRYALDWRLLPSLSMVESDGGRAQKRNNIFGWNSGRSGFPSVEAAIDIVAAKLGTSKLYRNKDLDRLLRTYNPNPKYAERVKSVMQTIGDAASPAVSAAVN